MNQKQIERKSLMVNTVVNLIIAGADVWAYLATSIQALFLDGFFSVVGLLSSVMAVVISKVSHRRTNSYPDGLYFLEPLYAVLKSVLTLALLGASVFSAAGAAFAYFVHGTGSPMNIGPVVPYAISMVILCFGLGFYNGNQNKKINNASIILNAESKSNMIDGMQSLAIGIAIVLLNAIAIDGALGFLHYTGDFFVTLVLALASIKQPVKVLIVSFKELSGGVTADGKAKRIIQNAVKNHLDGIVENAKCDVFKIGMHFKVRVSVVGDMDGSLLKKLKVARERVTEELKATYDSIELEVVV